MTRIRVKELTPLEAGLTDRQLEVHQYIRRYFKQFREAPTREEIQRAFGFKSPNAAQCHVNALIRKGALAYTPGQARGITPQSVIQADDTRFALRY